MKKNFIVAVVLLMSSLSGCAVYNPGDRLPIGHEPWIGIVNEAPTPMPFVTKQILKGQGWGDAQLSADKVRLGWVLGTNYFNKKLMSTLAFVPDSIPPLQVGDTIVFIYDETFDFEAGRIPRVVKVLCKTGDMICEDEVVREYGITDRAYKGPVETRPEAFTYNRKN